MGSPDRKGSLHSDRDHGESQNASEVAADRLRKTTLWEGSGRPQILTSVTEK